MIYLPDHKLSLEIGDTIKVTITGKDNYTYYWVGTIEQFQKCDYTVDSLCANCSAYGLKVKHLEIIRPDGKLSDQLTLRFYDDATTRLLCPNRKIEVLSARVKVNKMGEV